MAVGDQRAELPGRDVDLPLPQLLKQERLRHMRMVVLVQDESAQLRAEVHTPDLGRQLPDQAHSLGGDPALQPIPGIVHPDPDVLHHEILVALEATVLRNVRRRLHLDRLVDLKLCRLVALATGFGRRAFFVPLRSPSSAEGLITGFGF
jgi:hypothetical protein